MASVDDQPAAPATCSPCRGTGTVLSNLGGTLHSQPCPWCEGTGIEIPGHDAQAARRPADAEPQVTPETE